MVLTDLP